MPHFVDHAQYCDANYYCHNMILVLSFSSRISVSCCPLVLVAWALILPLLTQSSFLTQTGIPRMTCKPRLVHTGLDREIRLVGRFQHMKTA